MPVILKRREPESTGVVSSAVAAVKKVIRVGGLKPAPAPSPTNDAALELIGLAEPAPYQTAGDKVRALAGVWSPLSVGDPVVITNSLYPWVDRWLPGDLGVVERYASPVPEARNDGNKWALVVVRLKKPRVAGHEVCYFHRWELVLSEQPKEVK